jgi:hypothetical protein
MGIVFRSAKDLKDHLPSVLRDAARGDVVITMRGTPKAILRRFSAEELEGSILLRSRTVRRRVKRALDEARSGRTVSLQALIEQLGTPTR